MTINGIVHQLLQLDADQNDVECDENEAETDHLDEEDDEDGAEADVLVSRHTVCHLFYFDHIFMYV